MDFILFFFFPEDYPLINFSSVCIHSRLQGEDMTMKQLQKWQREAASSMIHCQISCDKTSLRRFELPKMWTCWLKHWYSELPIESQVGRFHLEPTNQEDTKTMQIPSHKYKCKSPQPNCVEQNGSIKHNHVNPRELLKEGN